MGQKKRSAPVASANQPPQRKRQAIELTSTSSARSNKRTRPFNNGAPKRSNRPGMNDQSSSEEDSAHSENEETKDESEAEEDSEETRRKELEAALRRHQLQFLQESSLLPLNSGEDDDEGETNSKKDKKGKGKEVKSVWDLGMDDLEDEEEESESESEQEEEVAAPSNKRVAEVVAFSEPGRSLSSSSILGSPSSTSLSGKELRDFKSGKIKSNVLAKPSVADEANQKYRGKKGGKKTSKADGEGAIPGGTSGKDAGPEDAEEETHLAKLDSHLSTLTRSLHSNSPASLPELLRELPLASSSKPLKGHTPLPKNAPRSLRSGQNAANLKRAQARDAAAGILPGSRTGSSATLGREAKSLKEKRKEEGLDKRERGMGGAVGKFGRGMISLSKGEIRRVQGMGGSGGSSSSKRGGKR
ncbi:hypothetical protein JCM3765_002688 [Sporobolomyces pararoseus]